MRKPHPLPVLAVTVSILLASLPAPSFAATARGFAAEAGPGVAPGSSLMAQLRTWLSILWPGAEPSNGSRKALKNASQQGRRPVRPELGCGPDPNGGAQCGSQVIITPPQHGTQP